MSYISCTTTYISSTTSTIFNKRVLFQIKILLDNNNNVPDIEQLSRPEFDLDIEQQKRLRVSYY